MLSRHIVSYLPSQIIPALTSMLVIVAYTHLMSPEQYGYYALIINGHLFLTIVCYGWLHNVVLRLSTKAAREHYQDKLRRVSYLLFTGLSIAAMAAAGLYQWIFSPASGGEILWFAVGLGITRGLLTLMECWHRANLNIHRFNLLECGQGIISLATGVGLVYFLHLGAAGGAIGMIFGVACMLWVDRRQMISGMGKAMMPMIRETLHMGGPLFASSILVFILTSIDRFMVEYYHGASTLGVYAAGYTLVDRIMQVLFLVIAMASYSLTVHRLEHEGMEAARAQTYRNGIGILALTLPACVGLIFCAPQLASIIIGQEFRAGALVIMPWITIASFCNGLTTHYFDHAFFLAKKPRFFLFTQGPCAVAYILLNILLIPRYGALGAAYATVITYVVLLALCIVLGRRAFQIHFPWRPAFKILAATAIMALVLNRFDFPRSFAGLFFIATLGTGVYGLGLLAFDLEGTRHHTRKLLLAVFQRLRISMTQQS